MAKYPLLVYRRGGAQWATMLSLLGYIAIHANENTQILKYVSILKYLNDLSFDYIKVFRYTPIL